MAKVRTLGINRVPKVDKFVQLLIFVRFNSIRVRLNNIFGLNVFIKALNFIAFFNLKI